MMEERTFFSASRAARTVEASSSLQATIEALKTPIAVLAASGAVAAVNSAWRAAAQRDDGDHCPAGDNYLDWLRMQPDAPFHEAFVRGVAGVLAGRRKSFESVTPLAGGSVERHVSLRRIEGEQPARFLLQQENRRPSVGEELEERVLKAQIEERERLAAELHDSLGQNFVSLGLALARLRQLTEPGVEAAGVIAEMADLLQQGHAEIRTLSFLLQPPWFDDIGAFEKAVRDLVSGFARRAGLYASIELREVPGLCRGRQLALFRVLQEALVNVYRHAKADAVEVELAGRGKHVVLKVSDNGHGMRSPEGAPPHLGVGLLGMRARLQKWGGDLCIISGHDGTSLTAKLAI